MARKKTYIYRILIGHGDTPEKDFFMTARNAGVAVDFCKELYRKDKYESYQAIKVGICHTLQDTRILDNEEAEELRKAGAERSEKFAEREIEQPKFITKEEAEELGL